MIKRTVLIAEDESIISLDLKIFLERNNFHCILVRTGEDLIKQFESGNPDLIIADFKLSGKVTCEEALNKVNKINSTPIIIISGLSTAMVEAFAKTLSHCSSLMKPIDKEELLKLISKFIPN